MIWAALAFAQDGVPVDAAAFRVASDAYRTVGTDEARVRSGWTANAAVHYQRDPLVYDSQDGTTTRLVADVVGLDLSGSVGIEDLVQLGFTVPTYLRVTSDTDPTRTVLGDAGLHLKAGAGNETVRAALITAVTLPLGASRYYLGSDTPSLQIGGAADLSVGPLYVSLNLGARIQGSQTLDNATLGSHLFVRSAIGVQATRRLAIALESRSRLDALRQSSFEGSADLLLGVHRTGPGLSPWIAGGTALTQAIGSPSVRILVGLRVAPGARND